MDQPIARRKRLTNLALTAILIGIFAMPMFALGSPAARPLMADGSAYPSGTPWAAPGTIQAEDFNTGGQGNAYNDTDTTNNGGAYRASEAVDIQATTDTGGGFNVGWTRAGEWLKYTINVQSSGNYTFRARVAAAAAGASFHVEIDGVNITGPISVPNTGGNQIWTTISRSDIVSPSVGQHVMRVVFDTPVTGGTSVGNYNFFSFSSAGPTATPTATNTPTNTPTATNTPTPTSRVEAETCTLSQAVVATNHTGFSGTGFVDYTNVSGSFIECTVNVAMAGSASVGIRYSNGTTTNRPMDIRVNGILTATGVAFNGTTNWDTWVTQNINLVLNAGANTIRLTATTANGGPNVDYLTVAGGSTPTPTNTPTNTPTPTTPPVGTTPVGINGQLHVCGTKICNQFGKPIQLRGMSTHGLQWYGWGKCITGSSLEALAKDWKADILRISLYVQEGGYETNPSGFRTQVDQIVDAAVARGMYTLLDWHMLDPGDPMFNLDRAKEYFAYMAQKHGNKPNVLYEIANEPNGVNWARIKSYAEQIIPVIRQRDPDGIIIIGTRAWSSLGVSDGGNAAEIVNNKVSGTNLMYTFHFYAASHLAEYRNELAWAADRLPIFVTEWGTQEFTGDGPNDFNSSQAYIDLMRQKQISWTSWNYSDDERSGAAFKVGTCPNGPFTGTGPLKPAGVWVRDKILNPPDNFPTN